MTKWKCNKCSVTCKLELDCIVKPQICPYPGCSYKAEWVEVCPPTTEDRLRQIEQRIDRLEDD